MGEKEVKNPNSPKEWDTARAILSKTDDRLFDLRKYGFTFIAALLTAESLLLPYTDTLNTIVGEPPTRLFWDPVNLPDALKFAVLFANLLLIIAVVVIDRNFIIIQKAAASRARVLERTLNLELTEVITHRYRSAKVEWWVTGLYSFFVSIVLTLGFFVFSENLPLFLVLLICGIITIFVIVGIRTSMNIEYKYGPIDFTLDRLHCTKGDKVAITVTNLEKEDIIIEPTDCLMSVKDENGKELKKLNVKEKVTIGDRGSYTFLLNTDELGNETKFEEGICRVYRCKVDKRAKKYDATQPDKKGKKYRRIIDCNEKEGKLEPLNRKLRVYKKSKEPSPSSAAELLKVLLDRLKPK